jgi:hypothetical protein
MDKKKAIALGLIGVGSALGLGYLLTRVFKGDEGPHICPTGQHWDGIACVDDPVDPTDPIECAEGYHPNADNTACIPDDTEGAMPINIYYMPNLGRWGVVAGWITQSDGSNTFLGITATWEVDGVPVSGTPTAKIEDISTIKVTLTDGVITGSMTATPSQITQDYGIIPSNVVGGATRAYGTGKLSGMRVYNSLGLTPEYCYVSFQQGKYPPNAWEGANSISRGFQIYGYGTGAGDYNIWSWTVCSMLEAYFRPMNDGETVLAFTTAAGSAWSGPIEQQTLNQFIVWTAMKLAFMFQYGASVLWDKGVIGDGTAENPWVYDDGWQGAGYYLGLPGSFYGTAQYVSEADKDLYF